MEANKTPILVCSVCIDGLEHHTWQGRVLTYRDEMVFQSERELILTMERLLEQAETGDQAQAT